ncbi:plasmid replication protein, CyRepA1 family [Synechococcus elongatus]|uniref:Plasmid replication protein n=1 Tax=Synechococcus elongatus (strain ATCC 33912 / PCC 7942 / FACHB-805) TaxID=1140 RepID=A0A140E9L9_SYNE7|nr:plasmid replication protein, CyRepA1 family [Synechococcus elongatus]AJD58985.1 hypothetical protein M744_14250 [Synechococcus elongatus UTEX 2973]AMK92588.1 plasmid replication protein [Synechococcus elongatus PCC 7942 = FACHB-805]MBD2708599.1 bifunctional DNA primase/polymerase [Synechococcus elongatus PCC 7942 = FACHB-805]UOW72501.1 bifunctional DNA primase/polymerase [Synechococcus elongatus PCC 7943]UOW75222.1 bifunctional DNA primase/polymerase [Synechococcus elongatus PCC 6311]
MAFIANHLQRSQIPTRCELIDQLDRLPPNWRFCVVNSRKAPFDPGWQNNPLDHAAVAERIRSDRRVTGIGLLTGPASGGLIAVDFDGPTAHEALPEGLTLTELPPTVAYTSGKPGRHQRLYQVPQERWAAIATQKLHSPDGDLLELRWNKLQSVIVGQHPETGAYRWVEGCAPWEIEVAEAPPELLDAMERQDRQTAPKSYKPIVSAPASDDEVAIARTMLAHVPASYADDYESWVAVGMALQSVSDALLDDWIAWSAQSSKFDGNRKLERKWASFKGSGITIATLAKLAKEGGYRPPKLTRQEQREYQREVAKQWQRLTRSPNRLHTGGYINGDYIPQPEQHRLVCLNAAMGTGKTEAIAGHLQPLIGTGIPVVLITHRRTLGAALGKRLGVPWAEECVPGSDLRMIGLGGCLDSMHPASKLRFSAHGWQRAIVVIDEVELWAEHLLSGKTEIAKHRPEVMAEIAGLLAGGRQVIAADAMLSDVSIALLEALTGSTAYLVSSTVQPFSGAPVYQVGSDRELMAMAVEMVQAGKRLAVFCDRQKLSQSRPSLYSAATIAQQLSEACGQPVPVIDSEANKRGALETLKLNPQMFINCCPHLVFTSVIDAGLSITQGVGDRPFDAVLIFAGAGHIAPGAIAQIAGRVRSNVPRFITCPDTSNLMRAGNGSIDPTEVADGLKRHQQVILAQLSQAAIKIGEPVASQAYLTAWAELAARRNRDGLTYAATVEQLLRLNGFTWQDWDGAIDPFLQEVVDELQRETAEALADASAEAILSSPDLTPKEAEAIASADFANAEQLAALARHRCQQRWGDCTRELLAADDDGLYAPLRLLFWLSLGKDAAAARDAAKLDKRRDRPMFGPDLVGSCIAPQVRYLHGLKVEELLQRRDWFSVDDPLIQEIVTTATSHRASAAQILKIQITDKTRASTIVRALLRMIGFKLKARQKRIAGKSTWIYQVVPNEAIAELPLEAIEAHWLENARSSQGLGSCHEIPNRRSKPITAHFRDTASGQVSTTSTETAA